VRQGRATRTVGKNQAQLGDRVFVGSACATPRSLVEGLERVGRPGVVLVHFLTDRVGIGDPPRTNYRHRVFYVGRDVRALGGSGWVEYIPLALGDVPGLFATGRSLLTWR
jgi:hypothetical protein